MTAAMAGGARVAGSTRRRTRRLHVGSLNVPVRRSLVHHPVMVAFITCGCIWTLVHPDRDILLFDDPHTVRVIRRECRLLLPAISSTGATTTTWVACLVSSCHGSMQRRKIAHHPLVLLLFVSMNGLRMLTQIIEAGELLPTMACERTFASVLSVKRRRRKSTK